MKKSTLLAILLVSGMQGLSAQSLEPRLYSNVPTDLNFLVAGYVYSQGALPGNSVLIDPNLQINSAIFAYAKGLNVMGKSAKVNLVIPSACINGSALYKGSLAKREVCGVGDIKVGFSLNFFGAPATSLKDFANYTQDTIIGVSLQTTLPTGRYDEEKLVNISANRWAAKLGFGVSKKISNFLIEFAVDAEYFTPNNEFLGKKRQQDIIYATQMHLLYTLPRGIWFGLNANYYTGGENTQENKKLDDALNNARYGATLAFPLSKHHSLKILGSSGIFTRAGTNFDSLGVFWQYRFMDGF